MCNLSIQFTMYFQSKTELLNEYLSHSQNPPQLSDEQLTQLTTYKLSASPIYLYMMANELRDMHVNRYRLH